MDVQLSFKWRWKSGKEISLQENGSVSGGWDGCSSVFYIYQGRGQGGKTRAMCQAVLGAVSISRARHPVLSLIPRGRQGPIYRCAIRGSYLNVSKCISHFIWMYQHVSPIFLPREPWLNVDHRWPCSRPDLTHVTNSKGVAPPHPPRVLSSDRQTAELSWPSQEGEPWEASQWPSVRLWLPLAHTWQNSRWPAISLLVLALDWGYSRRAFEKHGAHGLVTVGRKWCASCSVVRLPLSPGKPSSGVVFSLASITHTQIKTRQISRVDWKLFSATHLRKYGDYFYDPGFLEWDVSRRPGFCPYHGMNWKPGRGSLCPSQGSGGDDRRVRSSKSLLVTKVQPGLYEILYLKKFPF